MSSWHTAENISVTPEAASQINDTLTGGLIANWGRGLVEKDGETLGFDKLKEGFDFFLLYVSAGPPPGESWAGARALAGAVFSPRGGLDGQQIFSSSARRCNGLTVASAD